jgi:L,D-peptidoglycan transpeptidase YkuD (ErfK/YbiS/YcfS/YnhG family)
MEGTPQGIVREHQVAQDGKCRMIAPIASLRVDAQAGLMHYGESAFRCAIGKAGVTHDKKEGDGKTPLGLFLLRLLYYRPDRIKLPPLHSSFSVTPITPQMGWCDDPSHPRYNLPVNMPFSASHETLWREDGRYDLIIPLGYNDDPIVAGKGSAIFFHLASEDYQSTEGCVAIALHDMLSLLPHVVADMPMEIR